MRAHRLYTRLSRVSLLPNTLSLWRTWKYRAPRRAWGAKGHRTLRRTGDSMGTAVDTIRNISHTSPYTLPLPGIYLLQGCLSGTWWYATAKSGPSYAFSTSAIPWHNDRMSSRSFIFRRFLCAICEILWPEKLRYTDNIARGHSFRLLRLISYSDWKCAFGAPEALTAFLCLLLLVLARYKAFYLKGNRPLLQASWRQGGINPRESVDGWYN